MMRDVLYHPLFLHFPIALLTVGTVLRVTSLPFKVGSSLGFLRPTAWTTLSLGVAFAWVAVGTGLFAMPFVAPDLCDVNVLDAHKKLGISTAAVFSGSLFFDFIATLVRSKTPSGSPMAMRMAAASVAFLYAAGLVLIIFTGTLGSNLVYDQGAAVWKKCTSSEEMPITPIMEKPQEMQKKQPEVPPPPKEIPKRPPEIAPPPPETPPTK